jgi:AraC family transcriptional regulator
MPYERRVRFASPLVAWHELRLLEAHAGWGEWHRAPSPRLVLPQSGFGECEVAGGRRGFDALTPLWLTPEQAYRLRQPRAGQRSVVLVLSAEPPDAPNQPRLTAALQWRLAQQAAHIDAGHGGALALDEWVATLLQPADGQSPQRLTPRAQRAVERARQCLAAQPERGDGLAAIAREAGESPFHLARRFRALTGHTLHGYRTRLRMAQALARLRDGESDLTALALDLGYSSHSHFSASFRRCFGIAPGQARAQLRRNPTAPQPA